MNHIISSQGRKYLFAIISLGLIIRLTASYIQPAFLDEGFVYYVTKAGWPMMANILRYDTHAPIFNLLIYPLTCLTSDIFWLRMPSVMTSIGSMLLSFALARRFFSEKSSLAIVTFIACSYSIWLTDAQLRTYGPLMFLYMSLMLGIIDINRQGEPFSDLPWKRWRWPLFYLASIMCSILHVLGTLLIGTFILLSYWLPASARTRVIICFIASILPTAIWFGWARYGSTIQFYKEDTSSYYLQFIFTPLYILNAKAPNDIVGYSAKFGPSENTATFIIPIYIAINIILWILACKGWCAMIRQFRWEGAVICSSFLLPLLAILCSCLFGFQAYTQRYGVPMTVSLIMALGCSLSGNRKRWAYRLALGFTALLTAIFPFFPALWNQYWSGPIDYIDSVGRPGDIIGIYSPYTMYSFAMAYDIEGLECKFNKTDSYQVNFIHKPDSKRLPILSICRANIHEKFFDQIGDGRIILLLCQRFQGDDSLGLLNKYYHIVDGKRFYSLTYWADIEVVVLERDR